MEWIGDPTIEYKGKLFYNAARVGDLKVEPEDYVMLESSQANEPPYIAKVVYMWQEAKQGSSFHAHLFCRGTDTILGETSDPRELFVVDVCMNCPLGSIVRKAEVRLSNGYGSRGLWSTIEKVLEVKITLYFKKV